MASRGKKKSDGQGHSHQEDGVDVVRKHMAPTAFRPAS